MPNPILAGAAMRAATLAWKAARKSKLVRKAGRFLTKAGSGSASRGVERIGAGAAVTRMAAARGGSLRGAPPPPPGYGPRPAGPIRRTGQRIIPGGRTGRELTPATDMVSKEGLPLAVYPDQRTRLEAPKGYVIVTHPVSGEKIAMLRGPAQRAGLFKPRPKPPISGADARAIRQAARAKKRVKKLATNAGFACKPKKGR